MTFTTDVKCIGISHAEAQNGKSSNAARVAFESKDGNRFGLRMSLDAAAAFRFGSRYVIEVTEANRAG